MTCVSAATTPRIPSKNFAILTYDRKHPHQNFEDIRDMQLKDTVGSRSGIADPECRGATVFTTETSAAPAEFEDGEHETRANARSLDNHSAPGAIRTRDLPLRRRLLYPLSYKGGNFG